MKHFILPNMYENYELNWRLLDIMRDFPEAFQEDTDVYACYGNFQFCVWDGGRTFSNYNNQASQERIKEVLDGYKNRGIKIRFIFTNPVLEEKHFTDHYCNFILQMAQDYDIELVVNSLHLKGYIEKKYPNYKFVSSTTKCITDFSRLKGELSDESYEMVCLDYNLNNSEQIFKLPPEAIAKAELLCNAICGPACPYRKEHYRLNGICSLQCGKRYPIEGCLIQQNTLHPITCGYNTHISPQDINEKFAPAGFQYFKLEGRTLSASENALNYAKYLAKPEYVMWVANELCKDSR